MRKNIDGLFNTIISESKLSPMSGDVFVFFGKNRQAVKILKWDRDGFLLYHKRLERGTFEMPRINTDTEESVMSQINVDVQIFHIALYKSTGATAS